MGRILSLVESQRRFWARTIPEPNTGCLLWTGAYIVAGYGHLNWRGMRRRAHQVSYSLTHGPIPPGMGVLHRCDTPACVNPDHLFVGTQADNARDMWKKGRNSKPIVVTHCKRGHEYTPENTWANGTSSRRCRQCTMERNRQKRHSQCLRQRLTDCEHVQLVRECDTPELLETIQW